jgi:biotin transport system substrate-specific component
MKEVTVKRTWSAHDLTYTALGAVLIAVCSWIQIPATVPFTMQTFAVFAVLFLLGGRRGIWAVIVYILLGAVGFPVFSGFQGGLGVLLGTTGGYIVGFFFAALIYALTKRLLGDGTAVAVLGMVLGLIVCYAFGTAWFLVAYARSSGAVGLGAALSWCVFPFILPDLLKIALAVLLGLPLKRHIH